MPTNAQHQICETSAVHELPLTKDLIAALEDAGADPTSPDHVVVLAAYLDLLAKEFGLTESQALDTDPLARTEQTGLVMDVVRHYLGGGTELDADAVRARLYDVFVHLADDLSARKGLNRNSPLTKGRFLHLAQIYWNLEANDLRPRLPIKPDEERDIPVLGVPRDFATMLWTARGNEKGPSYKSSGAGFRKQGARLVVLAAKKLMENSEPMPDSAPGALVVQSTSDPEAPLEVALKELVERAQKEGQHDVAVRTASSYLSVIKQRAEVNPFESEPDLADAYLLRGWAQMLLRQDLFDRGVRADLSPLEDLDAATRSLSTLVDLQPDNVDHRANLAQAFLLVSMEADDHADQVAAAQRALATAEAIPAEHTEVQLSAELLACLKLATILHGADAIKAIDRAESLVTKLEAFGPSEPGLLTQASITAARAVIHKVRQGEDAAVEAKSEAVAAAEQLVAEGEEAQQVLVVPLAELAWALMSAGRHPEAALVAARALAFVTPEYVRANPGLNLERLAMIVSSDNSDRVTPAHIALLEAASEAAPGNMATLSFLLLAYDNLIRQRSDAGLDADAHAWVLRAVNAACRLRPTEIAEPYKEGAKVVLRSMQARLVGRLLDLVGSLTESPETMLPLLISPLEASLLELNPESLETAESVVTIARLLEDIDPGWADEQD